MATLVVGAGKTGLAVARFLAARGERVVVTDEKMPGVPDLPNVRWALGGFADADFLGADRIVLSPGVPDKPALAAARRKGVPITGEIQLASEHIAATFIGITGTNGKSTVTALCGALCAASGRPTFTGGNLGEPLIEAVGTPAAAAGGICVVELSSFQLETCETLRPKVAVLTNLSPDHLDRYGTMAAYGEAKARIFRAQTTDDHAVVYARDAACVALAMHGRARLHEYAAPESAQPDAEIVLPLPGVLGGERYPASELPLVGRHNLDNATAAYLAARLVGVPAEIVRRAAREFRSLPHRMEFVGERRGVRFYDDSKGTNVGAVVASIAGLPVPFVLIAGGRDKGGAYGPLVAALAGRARAVVLIGEAAPLIERAIAGAVPVVRAGTLDEAVAAAAERAQPGDAVVLSPACSSYDMFRDYHERGERFRLAVQELSP